ncbi:MAG TPA: hypothetical protein VLY82_02250 [Nitrososphaerales archaeon]|nr:hypothetical protein [Nitrososphaerales archaeon]
MKSGAIAALLVVAILAGAAAGYLIGVNRQGENNSTSAVSAQSSVEGLQLKASLNATSIKLGQRLGIAVSIYNTLPTTLNISASNAWKVDGFPIAMWGECYSYPPVEFMIVKGNYSLGALQAASSSNQSVELAPRLQLFCGGSFNGNIGHFIFRPASVNANLSGVPCTNVYPCGVITDRSHDLASNFTVDGYWTYPINSSEARDLLTPSKPCTLPEICSPSITFNFPEVGPIAEHQFTSGLYALVVDDEWGQVVILHFSVI